MSNEIWLSCCAQSSDTQSKLWFWAEKWVWILYQAGKSHGVGYLVYIETFRDLTSYERLGLLVIHFHCLPQLRVSIGQTRAHYLTSLKLAIGSDYVAHLQPAISLLSSAYAFANKSYISIQYLDCVSSIIWQDKTRMKVNNIQSKFPFPCVYYVEITNRSQIYNYLFESTSWFFILWNSCISSLIL